MSRMRVGLALLATLVGITLIGAGPASAAFDAQPFKKSLTKELTKRGWKVKQILGCKQLANKDVACNYQVKVTLEPGKTAGCQGRAVFSKKKKKWRIPPCYNELLWDELKAEGLTPKQIFGCKKKRSVVKCQFSSSGTYQGSTEKFTCGGFARYLLKKKQWRIPCYKPLLWNELIERGDQPTNIVSCQEQPTAVRCEWRAAGTRQPGSIPYQCGGTAVYTKKTGTWQIDPCVNQLGDLVPLEPTAGPHTVFGFNDDFLSTPVRNKLDELRSIGAPSNPTDVIRLTLSWSGVERTEGQALPFPGSMNGYDQVVDDAVAQGMKVVFVLQNSPCWAIDVTPCSDADFHTTPPKDSAVDDYARFAAFVASYYNARNPGAVYALEIWNEPNGGHFWGGLPPQPSRYATMLRQAAEKVHDAVATMPVVSAGLAPLSEGGSGAGAAPTFLAEMLKAGIGETDAIGYHMYFGEVNDLVLNLRRQIGDLKTVMQNNGKGDMPIWLTEFGVSGAPDGQGAQFSLDGQAAAFEEIYNTLRRIKNIPVTIWHRVVDGADNLSGGTDLRGVFDKNNDPKPIFNRMNTVLGGA